MTHPVGRSSTPVPWLSALLVVVIIAFSVHARLRHAEVSRQGLAALDAAREYFLAHPYLEPGSALLTRLDEATVQRARAESAQREAASGIPTPPGVIRRQQGELDEMVGQRDRERGRAARAAGRVRAAAAVPRHTWLAYPLLHVGNAVLIGNGAVAALLRALSRARVRRRGATPR